VMCLDAMDRMSPCGKGPRDGLQMVLGTGSISTPRVRLLAEQAVIECSFSG
jgi:hypothetical protein